MLPDGIRKASTRSARRKNQITNAMTIDLAHSRAALALVGALFFPSGGDSPSSGCFGAFGSVGMARSFFKLTIANSLGY